MLIPIDERRDLLVPGNYETTLSFCVKHLLFLAEEAIRTQGHFFAALSGGSTPHALFEKLSDPSYRTLIDWSKVSLFWSDERSVPFAHPENNSHMAMEAGLKKLPIPVSQIHRMVAEKDLEKNAKAYEETIKRLLGSRPFDLIMLGMGEDGHTASLFPHTEALASKDRLVVPNYVPQKNSWRMTMTFECINSAQNIVVYVLGASKKERVAEVLLSPPQFTLLPAQRIGTVAHPALWIADQDAAATLLKKKKDS